MRFLDTNSKAWYNSQKKKNDKLGFWKTVKRKKRHRPGKNIYKTSIWYISTRIKQTNFKMNKRGFFSWANIVIAFKYMLKDPCLRGFSKWVGYDWVVPLFTVFLSW